MVAWMAPTNAEVTSASRDGNYTTSIPMRRLRALRIQRDGLTNWSRNPKLYAVRVEANPTPSKTASASHHRTAGQKIVQRQHLPARISIHGEAPPGRPRFFRKPMPRLLTWAKSWVATSFAWRIPHDEAIPA